MPQRINKKAFFLVVTLISMISLAALLIKEGGYRFNFTESFPYGIYQDIKNKNLSKGDMVVFCPPKKEIFDFAMKQGFLSAGECPNGSVSLLKKVVAMDGDSIKITDKVYVNGEPVKKSTIQKFPYKSMDLTLGKDQLFLMSDFCEMSFDSRYFGEIDRKQIVSIVRPVFTWQ